MGTLPLYGGTFARSYSVSILGDNLGEGNRCGENGVFWQTVALRE